MTGSAIWWLTDWLIECSSLEVIIRLTPLWDELSAIKLNWTEQTD